MTATIFQTVIVCQAQVEALWTLIEPTRQFCKVLLSPTLKRRLERLYNLCNPQGPIRQWAGM